MKDVVVLGGGFAGLAAAVKLTSQGHRVTLVERRHQLGGRAFSFTDPTTGDTVDNGQHLLMRCYQSTLELLEALSALNDIVFQNEFQIEFRHPTEGVSKLHIPKALPQPFNLLSGFLRFKAVSLKDVFALRKIKPHINKELPLTLSVSNWLRQCDQSKRISEHFWHPLCLAALNAPPDKASAKFMQAVIKEGFFSSSDGAVLGYSRLGLSNLISTKAKAFFKANDQNLHLGLSAKKIELASPTCIKLHLSNTTTLTPDAIICAVPPQALSALLPRSVFPDLFQTLKRFHPSPILSVNLWYDKPTLALPFIGMVGTKMEWAFAKSQLYEAYDNASPGHISLIASAAEQLTHQSSADLITLAHKELTSIEPTVAKATLTHARVICEHRATQLLPLGECPPPTTTKHPKLLLAGDWVDTGLPATIESAVRSGFQAASAVHQKE